jgi:hypothetical protein
VDAKNRASEIAQDELHLPSRVEVAEPEVTKWLEVMARDGGHRIACACRRQSIDARHASHHYAAVMEKRCFA